MRALVVIIARRMVRSRFGRWALTIILFLCSAAGFISYPSVTTTRSATDGLTALATGIVCAVLGLLMLIVTIRIERMGGRVKRAEKRAQVRVNELKAKDLLLPIPALPPTPQGISPETIAHITDYADRMAKLPWGDHPQVTAADAPTVFNRTVARVRRIRGDWSLLAEPIDIFVGLSRPLCSVGAAEIMHRLSYISGTTFGAAGLRQGLRFIAHAQYTEPLQPDALVIRTKLLAASSSKTWLELADQTLELLRKTAPDHPRLPDAEAAVHLRRGEYEAAIACYDRLLTNPPSPEEAFVALANKASALEHLKRYAEALETYQRVLQIDPNDAWVWHNASIILMNQGRLDEALEANSRALSIMDFSNAHAQRELILAKMAERSGATANARAEEQGTPPR